MNKTLRIIGFLLILVLISKAGFSQGQQRVWQLSGLVVGKKDREPVAFAKIQINHSRRGIIANSEGFYSIPVVETDTVYFMHLGYKPSMLVMEDYINNYGGDKSSPYLYVINYLEEDTIILPTVTIHPYDNPEKLRTAMLAMNLEEFSDAELARANMDPEVLAQYIENLPIDAGERVLVGKNLYYQQHQTKNLMPVMPLFDPVAVYRLLRYINDKSKKERDENLNYWED